MNFSHNPTVRFASTLVLLAGLWFIVSPWVFGVASPPMAFNNWMVGGMVVAFAGMRLTQPGSQFASWTNVLLGLWVIASPVVQAYTFDHPRAINTVAVGIVITLAAFTSARSHTYSV